MTHEAPRTDNDPVHAKLGVENEASSAVEITAEDIRVWKAGAEAFRKFVRSLPDDMRGCWKEHRHIQAMFLREKPAIFFTESQIQELEPYLSPLGFRCLGAFAYNPEVVEQIVREYSDEFRGLPTESLEALMSALNAEEQRTPIGLVLGYPLASCKAHAIVQRLHDIVEGVRQALRERGDEAESRAFESAFYGGRIVGLAGRGGYREEIPREERRTTMVEFLLQHGGELGVPAGAESWLPDAVDYHLNAHAASTYGMQWNDYSDSVESIVKQRRLKAAFEQSGILEDAE